MGNRAKNIDLEIYPDSVDSFGCCETSEMLAKAYKAMGHPVRVMILSKLAAKDKSHCCGDICSGLPLAQSTVSQHLKVLREMGFIELKASGQQSHYRINKDRIDWFLAANDRFLGKLRNLPAEEA